MLSPYAALVAEPPAYPSYCETVTENSATYHILTERHLQAMWLEQKYFKSLSMNGRQIEVLSPGIWNSEAGPDFLKAHLKIGTEEWRGDIELHLSQEGWYHHGHHTDPNYAQVVLHVCYWPSKKEHLTLTSAGKPVPVAFMKPALTIPESRILKLIDLDLYPYQHFAGSGKCSQLLFNRLSQKESEQLLRSAAIWRLKEKKERLDEKLSVLPVSLMGGVAMVLGYKHNAEAFLTIFEKLLQQDIKGEPSLLAYALGISGFFTPHFQEKWRSSAYYQQLFQHYQALGAPSPAVCLRLDKIRPANHPVRRLAALVKMICDPAMLTLEATLLSLWSFHWNNKTRKNWQAFKTAYADLIPSYPDEYWERHYTFENYDQLKCISLVGDDFKQEMLINIFLPFLYADIERRNNETEKQAFIQFYHSISATKTNKSHYLGYRFFGNQQIKLAKADLQQGAYQIHRDFCIHFEASCQGCPFVDRYFLKAEG